jgi:hypothetical protein
MKPTDISIIQITNNGNTIYGLGSDQNMYQWNMLDGTWRVYNLKDREKMAAAQEAHENTAPHSPIA